MIDLYAEIQESIGWAIVSFFIGLFLPVIARLIDRYLEMIGGVALLLATIDLMNDLQTHARMELYEVTSGFVLTAVVIVLGEVVGIIITEALMSYFSPQ